MQKEDGDDFSCERCGKCCQGRTIIGLKAEINFKDEIEDEVADINRWRNEGRYDILEYADPFDYRDPDGTNYDIWFDPDTGIGVEVCPFLRENENKDEYECLIQNTKPKAYREYPLIEHGFICLRIEEILREEGRNDEALEGWLCKLKNLTPE